MDTSYVSFAFTARPDETVQKAQQRLKQEYQAHYALTHDEQATLENNEQRPSRRLTVEAASTAAAELCADARAGCRKLTAGLKAACKPFLLKCGAHQQCRAPDGLVVWGMGSTI